MGLLRRFSKVGALVYLSFLLRSASVEQTCENVHVGQGLIPQFRSEHAGFLAPLVDLNSSLQLLKHVYICVY
jgi:hypothetical protein